MTTRSKLSLRTAARYPSNQTKLGPAPFASFDQDGSTSIEVGDSTSNYGGGGVMATASPSSSKLTEIQERCYHGDKNRSSAPTPTTPHIAVSPASTASTSSPSHSNSEHELFHEKLFKIESRELRSSTEEMCCQGDDHRNTNHGNFLSLSPRDEMLRRASQPMLINRRGSCSPIDDLLSNCGFRKWSLDSRPKSSLSGRSHSPCKNLMLETSFCGSRPIPTKSIEAEEVVLVAALPTTAAAAAPPPTNKDGRGLASSRVAMATAPHHHNSIYIESSFLGDGMRGISVDSCSNPFDVFRQQESTSSIGSFDGAAPPINIKNYSLDSGETSPPHSSSHWSPYNCTAAGTSQRRVEEREEQRPQEVVIGSHGSEDVMVAIVNTHQQQPEQQPEQSNQFSISNLSSSSSSSSSLSSLPSLPTTLPTSRPTTSLTPSSMRTTTNTMATAAIERPRPTPTTKELDKYKLVSYIQENHGNPPDSTTATTAANTRSSKISIKLPHQINSGGSVDEEERSNKRRVSDWGQFAERLQSPSRVNQQSSGGGGRRGSSK